MCSTYTVTIIVATIRAKTWQSTKHTHAPSGIPVLVLGPYRDRVYTEAVIKTRHSKAHLGQYTML